MYTKNILGVFKPPINNVMDIQSIVNHLSSYKNIDHVYLSDIKNNTFDYCRPNRYCLISYKLNTYRGYLDGQVLSRNGNLVKSFRYLEWRYSNFFNSFRTLSGDKEISLDEDFDRSFQCMQNEALKYNAKEIIFRVATLQNNKVINYSFIICDLPYSEEHVIERKKEQYVYQKMQIEHYNKALSWIDTKDSELYKLHELHCQNKKNLHNDKAKKLGKQLGIHVFGI